MNSLVPLVLLALITLAVTPVWPWSKGWGWAPFGIFAIGLATLLLFRFSVLPEA